MSIADHVFTAPARPEPVDRDPSRRPGVPMLRAARPTQPIQQQEERVPVLVGPEVFHLTPIFGTAQPLHGVSGAIRRRAYRIPEHKAGRWLSLLVADRVDVIESAIRRRPATAAGLGLALLGGLMLLPARAAA